MVYMNPHFPGGCAETHFTNACLEVELELFQILVSHANAQLTRSVSRPEKKNRRHLKNGDAEIVNNTAWTCDRKALPYYHHV